MIDIELETFGTAYAQEAEDRTIADDLNGYHIATGAAIAAGVAGVGALIYLAATAEPGEYQPDSQNTSQPVYEDSGSDSGGIGMTYGGDLGIEISPGIVYTFDGELGLGF